MERFKSEQRGSGFQDNEVAEKIESYCRGKIAYPSERIIGPGRGGAVLEFGHFRRRPTKRCLTQRSQRKAFFLCVLCAAICRNHSVSGGFFTADFTDFTDGNPYFLIGEIRTARRKSLSFWRRFTTKDTKFTKTEEVRLFFVNFVPFVVRSGRPAKAIDCGFAALGNPWLHFFGCGFVQSLRDCRRRWSENVQTPCGGAAGPPLAGSSAKMRRNRQKTKIKLLTFEWICGMKLSLCETCYSNTGA